MAVLMTYHKLIERDSKNVDIHWKAASIILLVIAIFCSLAVSLSLQKLTAAFDDRCVLGSHFEFETEENQIKNSLKSDEENSTTIPAAGTVTLQDVFNTSYADFLGENAEKEFPVEQVRDLYEKQINLRTVKWGDQRSCDFGVYTPICQCCFAIIVMTMFVICGKGGKGDESSYLSEPWRIVVPALVFFTVMTALSLAILVVIESGLGTFCGNFKKAFPDISCTTALNRYMTKTVDNVTLSPGTIHIILSIFDYITFFTWLISALVLVARIIFVIDFQLVRVTVKTIEYENATPRSNFKVVEIEGPEGSKSIPNISYKKLYEEYIQEKEKKN